MKYPQLVSTPAVVKEWLEAELECLGIDSAAYARTVLSLLSRDTIDPAEVIQSGYVLVANKGTHRGGGGPGGPHHPPRSRGEELKRAEVIECLRSASEDQGGIQLLVDQLIGMLKQLPAAGTEPGGDTETDSSRRPATGDPNTPDDPVLRYEAAFPALCRGSPGVIPLTYFSKMGRPAAAAAAPAAGLWRCQQLEPAAAVWPTSLDHLRLLLPPAAYTAPLEPADAAPPPPPKPPEPADTARVIHPSAETHFQPIRRASGDDAGGADWPPPATYDARLYTRSDSGGLYLEQDGPQPAAEPPQKYMIFRERSPFGGECRGLAPKFKLSCNEKYCQTDEPAADGDLLQILVSGEQAGEAGGAPAGDADDDDDSSYEVLSSLQQTLHSIYEDGSDSGAEPELEADPPPPPARRPSAFARVRRPPPAGAHRPLYLRGGGADSLLAAVYTGGDWSAPGEAPEPADHRPLYARRPSACAAGPAEFAEHRQLRSGRISGSVYTRQGPTEYPALRYQLAGRDLPEVTFCRLGGDTHRSGPLKEPSAAAADWEVSSDAARSSREPSVGSEAASSTLWQAAGERERRDPSADRALWEARAEPGRRRSSVDSAIWEPEPGALWEPPRSLEPELTSEPGALWEPPRSLEPELTSETGALWEAPRSLEPEGASEPTTLWGPSRSLVETEGAHEPAALWEQPRSLEPEPEPTAPESAVLWEAPRGLMETESAQEPATLYETPRNLKPEGGREPGALWELSRSLVEKEGSQEPGALWEAPRTLAEPEGAQEHAIWEPRRAERESSIEMAIWETSGEQSERAETTTSNIWDPGAAPASRDTSIDAFWASREVTQREKSIDETHWEFGDEPSQRDKSADDARWELPRRQDSAERSLWESPAELCRRDGSVEKTIWEASEEPPGDTSAKRALWEPTETREAAWPADPPLWEPDEAGGWPCWQDAPIRAPEHIWRRGEAAGRPPEWSEGGGAAGEGEDRPVWRLGGDDVLAQTGLYPAEMADAGRSWEFIDENNVKNKIDSNVGPEGGPLASELADGCGSDWRVLPALRQLSACLGLAEGAPLPDGVALKAWALEEQWRRDEGPQRPARDRRVRRADRKRPCSYFMEGNCKRNDCKFSHDLSAITCVFWEEGACFKGVHCPFLHGYPEDDEEDEDSSDSAKRAVPKKSFKLEKEDFPSLHNIKKCNRNDEEENRKAGSRRNCRRHKSFSDASLGSGDAELPRPAIGGRGKRRRHHSKSEGVRPADTGARRP